jgi:hypothetical protein
MMKKVKDYLFAVVASDGSTPAKEPKLAAYNYMADLQRMGYTTSLVSSDGKFSVAAPGLQTLTFFRG